MGRQALRPGVQCPALRGAAGALRALCPAAAPPLPPPPPGGERREKPLPEGWGLLWGLGMWILASAKGSGGILGAGHLGAEQGSVAVRDSKEHETPPHFLERVLLTRASKNRNENLSSALCRSILVI